MAIITQLIQMSSNSLAAKKKLLPVVGAGFSKPGDLISFFVDFIGF
jgi:hypothetical protein